jgi:hypothetical protein
LKGKEGEETDGRAWQERKRVEEAGEGERVWKRPEWEKAGGSGRWRRKQVEASGRLGIGWKAEQLAERVLAYGRGWKGMEADGSG